MRPVSPLEENFLSEAANLLGLTHNVAGAESISGGR